MNGDAPIPAAIVLAGGDPVAPALIELLPTTPTWSRPTRACTSRAARPARRLRRRRSRLGRSGRRRRRDRDGTTVERHPADKDATDLELAFDARDRARRTADRGRRRRRRPARPLPRQRRVARVAGARRPRGRGVLRDRAHRGRARRRSAGGDRRAARQLVTLLPVGGAARGITTEGLQYPLHGEELAPGTTRGVSNVLVGDSGSVGLDDGNAARRPAVRRCAVNVARGRWPLVVVVAHGRAACGSSSGKARRRRRSRREDGRAADARQLRGRRSRCSPRSPRETGLQGEARAAGRRGRDGQQGDPAEGRIRSPTRCSASTTRS